MNIIKYDQAKGRTIVNNTTSQGGGTTQPDYSDALASLSSSVSKNTSDISTIQSTISQLDSKYLKHGGDSDGGTYEFGDVVTDDLVSANFFNYGMGFRAFFDSDGYKVIVKDIGVTTVPFAKTTGTSSSLTPNDFTDLSVQLDNAFQLTNDIPGACVFFEGGVNALPAGATITYEQAYASIVGIMRGAPGSVYIQLFRDGNKWVVPLNSDGRAYSYNIYFECTVSYAGQLDVYAAAQVKGTINDTTTQYYGGTSKQSIVSAAEVLVEEGMNGIKITPTGILKTTDGGATWINY